MNRLKKIYQQFHNAPLKERDRLLGYASMWFNYVWAVVKFFIGVFSSSFFFFLSGMYSACLGLARFLTSDGMGIAKHDLRSQRETYSKVILVLLAATAVSVAYMIRLFFIPTDFVYRTWVAAFTAAIAIAEFVVACFGVVHSFRRKDLLLSSITGVNLHSAFSAIILAQVSLFSLAKSENAAMYVSVGGVVFGILGLLVCLVMFVVYYKTGKYLQKLKFNEEMNSDVFR